MIASRTGKATFGVLFVFALGLWVSTTAEPVGASQGAGAIRAASADDADYAAFVKKATTRPEYLSPLVDHLRTKAGVPSPKEVLGAHIGTEKTLTYVADQQRYFRALEKALPGRFKTEIVGKTEEGRDIMVAYVSSEANIKNLETNRQNTRRLADPRGLSDAEAQRLIGGTKPHYHISAGLHSGETSPPGCAARKVGQYAAQEVGHLRGLHSTCSDPNDSKSAPLSLRPFLAA